MNVIFLDIDGVLNSYCYFESINQSQGALEHTEIRVHHVQLLSKIYHTCDAKIVLASSWRTIRDSADKDCMDMWNYLIDSLAAYNMEIVDYTPVIHLNRPKEIAVWLKQHSHNADVHFVILDDDFPKEQYDVFGLGNYLVKTEFWTNNMDTGGLQQGHVKKAIKILKEQQYENKEN